jgi:hypothetical protein
MTKVCCESEEAVALLDLYIQEGCTLSVPNEALAALTQIYRNRAQQLGLSVDNKFRNLSGLKMQIVCIHYVVTNGAEGMSNVNQLFYKTYELYRTNPAKFYEIRDEFYQKYRP